MAKITVKEFIKRIRKIHGDKYDYSLTKYINSKTKVCIICSKHSEFWQRPYDHWSGHGCPECGNEQIQIKERLTTSEFIRKAIGVHGDKYDYSNVNYRGSHDKVEIKCLKHGSFWQQPNCHLSGQGCPKCSQSHMETDVMKFLEKKNIKYIPQYKYDEQYKLSSLDFYLPEYNIAIECQGEQHFFPVDFGNNGKEYAEKWFIKNLESDKTKFDRCKELNIKLYFYVPKNSDKYINNELYNFIYTNVNIITNIENLINII